MSSGLETEVTTRRGFLGKVGLAVAGLTTASYLSAIPAHADSDSTNDQVEAATTPAAPENNLDSQPSLTSILRSLKIGIPVAAITNQFYPFIRNSIGQPLDEKSITVPAFDPSNSSSHPDADQYTFNGFEGHKDVIVSQHVDRDSSNPRIVLFMSINISSLPEQKRVVNTEDVITQYGNPDKISHKPNDNAYEMIYGQLGLSFSYPDTVNHFGSPDVHQVDNINLFQPMAPEQYEAGWFQVF